MNQYDCDFFNPVDFEGAAPTSSADFWQFKNSTCVASSTESQIFVNGFSYGEIVISIFLFMLLLVMSYTFLFFWVRGIKRGRM